MAAIVQAGEATVDAARDGLEVAGIGELVAAVARPPIGGGQGGVVRLFESLRVQDQVEPQRVAAAVVIVSPLILPLASRSMTFSPRSATPIKMVSCSSLLHPALMPGVLFQRTRERDFFLCLPVITLVGISPVIVVTVLLLLHTSIPQQKTLWSRRVGFGYPITTPGTYSIGLDLKTLQRLPLFPPLLMTSPPT